MQGHKSFDEKTVLELLAKGSEYAFMQLFDRYRARIFSVALAFLKSRELAEEVVQDIFLKIWRKREDWVKIVHFESYLFRMTRNEVFDRIKDIAEETTAKKEFAYGIQSVNGTDHELIEKQYEELLQEAVNQLPPKQKQIFRLAKMEGMSHQTIAKQLNISRLTVKTHMAKALQTIRHSLQRHITSFPLLPLILGAPDQLF